MIYLVNDTSRRGDYGELMFMLKATSENFIVSKPFGSAVPYDFIVDGGRLMRVQVRSAFGMRDGGYRFSVTRQRRRYKPGEIDALAAFLAPEDLWYIIPATVVIEISDLRLFPNLPHTRSKYERFREAWHLLRQPA